MTYGNPQVEPGEPPSYLAEPVTRVWRVTYRQMIETEELVFAPSAEQAKKAVNGDGRGFAFEEVGVEPMGPRRFIGIEELPEVEANEYWRPASAESNRATSSREKS